MSTQVARIMCLILTGITIAICTGFTVTGDLPMLLAISVAVAVIIACICGSQES